MEPHPSDSPSRPSRFRQSVGVKVAVIALLVALLLIPLSMLDNLISERQEMRRTVQREVSAQWGLAQTIGGPVLSVPYAVAERQGNNETIRRGFVHFLPKALDIEASLDPHLRRRDIYEVILYGADVEVRGHFGSLDPAGSGVAAEALDWSQAVVSVGITDMTGLKTLAPLAWGGRSVAPTPGVPTNDVFGAGLSFPVGAPADTSDIPFALTLQVNGSTSLSFLPFGEVTEARVAGGWGTPSFAGRALPDTHAVTDADFEARWRVLYFNRNYPQVFAGPIDRDLGGRRTPDYVPEVNRDQEEGLSAFGVRLLLPLDEYQKTQRSAEYGLLCLVLTFTTIFFVEILGRRRLHPMQYLLVGFAVALFYLLLLAFAEYVRFNAAYVLAAAAVLALILLYTRAVFRSWRYAGVVTGLLVVFYGYFFVLLQAEAYALLLGSLGLLVILGAVMYLSRNVDWYAVSTRGRDDSGDGPG